MKSVTFAILGILCSPAGVAAPEEPAIVARDYMTGLFHGDIATVSRLTHPKTKESVKSGLVRDYRTAKAQLNGAAFLASLQLKSEEELLQLSANEAFEVMLRSKSKAAPAAFREAMQKASVQILDVGTVDERTRRVKVSIAAPSVSRPEVTEISVSYYQETWLVER